MAVLLKMQTTGELFGKICLKAIRSTFLPMSSATMKEQGEVDGKRWEVNFWWWEKKVRGHSTKAEIF